MSWSGCGGRYRPWQELRYERTTGADGYDSDRNLARRAMVLWALQYDRGPEDLPLLRWLVEQEAACRRAAPFQGLTVETELAGFLLAAHRHVEDVWLQWTAKQANFDTWCGYDLEHLLAAGGSTTIEFVRASDHRDRDSVLEYLLDSGGQHLADADLVAWFEHKRSWFPSDPTEEDPINWVDRALLVGDHDLARRYLDRWTAGREGDRSTLSQLCRCLSELGDFAGAAGAQRDLIAFVTDPLDKASAWRSLAELERDACHHHAAWEALGSCRQALVDVPGWEDLGIGRSYVEQLFRLARDAEGELAQAGIHPGRPHRPNGSAPAACRARSSHRGRRTNRQATAGQALPNQARRRATAHRHRTGTAKRIASPGDRQWVDGTARPWSRGDHDRWPAGLLRAGCPG